MQSNYTDKEIRTLKNAFRRALKMQAGRIRGEPGTHCYANEVYTMKRIRAFCKALEVGQIRIFTYPPKKLIAVIKKARA